MTVNPIAIDRGLCIACGACAAVCPQDLIELRSGTAPLPSCGAELSCIHCGHCVAVCPQKALRHERLDPAGFPPLPAPLDFETILGFLRARRSVRVFRSEPVAEEAVRTLLLGARYAPSGHNARHVGCTVVLDGEAVASLRDGIIALYRRLIAVVENPFGRLLSRLVLGRGRVDEILDAMPGFQRAAARLEKGGDPLFHGAPALLLFHAPGGKETAEVDCALAAGQVTLLAGGLGLGTCHIGYASAALKRRPGLARAVGVPEGRAVFVVLTLGYPAFFYRRLVPRPPLDENVSLPGGP